MIIVVLLFSFIFFSGYLTNLPRESRFSLPKAFILVIIESLLAIIFFLVAWLVFTLIGDFAGLFNHVNTLFLLVLVIAILCGIGLYWLQLFFFPKLKHVTPQVLTLAEYIIQWGLIYITVYQVVFDGLFSKISPSSLSQLNISTPSELMVLILPSFISVWIAIILYKINQKQL